MAVIPLPPLPPRATLTGAAVALGLAGWSLACAGWMRPPYGEEFSAAGLADERVYYAQRSGRRNPITLGDFLDLRDGWASQGVRLGEPAAGGIRQLLAGDLVRVELPAGSVEVHAVIDPAVRPGVLCMPIGAGHTDYGRYAQGRGANVMSLVGATPVEGTSALARASTLVRVTRVGEGRLVRFGRRYEGGEEEVIPVGWAPMDLTRPDREARV